MNSSSSKVRNIIVTGGNKGIGYEIIKGLYSNNFSCHIILTARNEKLGQESLEKIKSGCSSSKNSIEFRQLDINDEKSVDTFCQWAKDSLKTIDVLVNNAGYGFQIDTVDEHLLTLKTNFFSLVELTDKLMNLLSDDAKIVNVSSGAGDLQFQSKDVKTTLRNKDLTKEQLMKLANELVEVTKNKGQEELGWDARSYYNSKCLLNAYTRFILPREMKKNQSVYSLTPGFCATDMTAGMNPTLTAEDGAQTPIYLIATLPFERNPEYNGQFFRSCKVETYDKSEDLKNM